VRLVFFIAPRGMMNASNAGRSGGNDLPGVRPGPPPTPALVFAGARGGGSSPARIVEGRRAVAALGTTSDNQRGGANRLCCPTGLVVCNHLWGKAPDL
jgi:hypothetical protein